VWRPISRHPRALDPAPAEMAEVGAAMRAPDRRSRRSLAAALADELPAFRRDGGFVRAGYDPALDEPARCATNRAACGGLQARYARRRSPGLKTGTTTCWAISSR